MLIKGVDDDAISYESVIEAFKSKDEAAIESALLTSALVAYDIQSSSLNALYYVEKMIELCNKNLLSDILISKFLNFTSVSFFNLIEWPSDVEVIFVSL